MIWFQISTAAAVVFVASALGAGPSIAADLGGNCCADLEERIAELEATTVRKGNRKVSLTISGWVAEQVTFWDDGVESNTYVHGVGSTLASHFKFNGEARFAPGWTAGYVLHVEANSAETTALDQDNDDGNPRVGLLQSYWFIRSDQLGKLSVGQLSQASDNTAILVDGSGSLVPANWVLFDGAGFILRNAGQRLTDFTGTRELTWGGSLALCQHIDAGIGADCNGVPLNAVRYDTPTFAGFSASASWGEDDFWDVAARYAGEFGGFKLAVAAAYSEQTEGANAFGGKDSGYVQVGAYLQHLPTGLFVYGAYGEEFNYNSANRIVSTDGLSSGPVPEGNHWYVKAGLRQRWTPLGHTVLYGEYGQHNDMYDGDLNDLANGFAVGTNLTSDSELERWGLGVVQEIDSAAMSIWLKYRNHSGEISGNSVTGTKISVDEAHFVGFGALINF
ncbi:MAG: porin [Pseudomonadota bacterium]